MRADSTTVRHVIRILLLLALVVFIARAVVEQKAERQAAESAADGTSLPVPVLVGAIEHGPITLRRTFSGTLEASSEFVAAPKVGGRLERLAVDLGDPVARGQVIALLDDDELVQAVNQAEAELAVADASFAEAENALEIADREMSRAERLSKQGVTSDSQLDSARAEQLAAQAHVAVTNANITRARAALETARIRLAYASVTADWSEGDDQRIVAERLVDEGSMVSANTPLLSIVDLDPLVGVINVPERDYAHLAVDQHAILTTDSYPGRQFEGRVVRIAPVFRNSTRQARVELLVENTDQQLKPGMFVRATLELARIEDATVLPFEALTERGGVMGVFVLNDADETVAWTPVEAGVREGRLVQILDQQLSGRVVTLGQELCDDGGRVTISDSAQSSR